MCVSVKKIKSNDPGAASAAQLSEVGEKDADAPASAAVFKKFLRSIAVGYSSGRITGRLRTNIQMLSLPTVRHVSAR